MQTYFTLIKPCSVRLICVLGALLLISGCESLARNGDPKTMDFVDVPEVTNPPTKTGVVNERRGVDLDEVTCPPGQFGRDAKGGLLFTSTGIKPFRCRQGSRDYRGSADDRMPVVIEQTGDYSTGFDIQVEKLNDGAGDPCYRYRVGGQWRYVCW